MAAPSLNLFPSIQQVERRREELDELIKKSMESRPSRSHQRERPGQYIRPASRSRSRAPLGQLRVNTSPDLSVSPKPEPLLQLQPPVDIVRSHTVPLPDKDIISRAGTASVPAVPEQRRPSIESRPIVSRPTEFNPHFPRTDPLPAPPTDAPSLKRTISRSPAKGPPRRMISIRHGGRDNMSMHSTGSRLSATPSTWTSSSGFTSSPGSSTSANPTSHFSAFSAGTEFTHQSVYGDAAFGPFFKENEARYQQELSKNAAFGITEHTRAALEEIHVAVPPPRTASRMSYQTHNSPGSVSSPPRDIPSRASHRPQDSILSRVASPDPTLVGGSPMSTRGSIAFAATSPEDFYMPEKKYHFSGYDTASGQVYTPKAFIPPPAQLMVSERPSPKAPSEAAFNLPSKLPSMSKELSDKTSLEGLWNVSNGQITTHIDGPFKLRMFRPNQTSKRREKDKLVFGTSEFEPFYSICQYHPGPEADENEAHEAMIFRHHATEDELLPISHMTLVPPPAPSGSRVSRASMDLRTKTATNSEAAQHITTIAPVLATLHALDHAAKTPQAHTLALVDPKAESPAAAKMAERAVRAAQDRESCTLSWTAVTARTGRYELHHPNLGVFEVVVDGDVKCAVNTIPGPHVRRPAASIAIMNPFANFKPPTINGETPMTGTFGVARGSGIGIPTPADKARYQGQKPAAELVRLDFSNDVLQINAPDIQALGNIYLLDICISTILAVLVAETQRPTDPGLLFAAPPVSLALINKGKGRTRLFSTSSSTSSSTLSLKSAGTADTNGSKTNSSVSLVLLPRRNKNGKQGKAIDWSNGVSAIMGIEHLADSDDLPRITRGILSVLGAGFKTALWLLEFGVKVSAKMVIGLSKLAEKM